MEDLNFFVLSDVWKGCAEIQKAIVAQYNQLDPQHQQGFGTPDFWNQDSDTDVVEWNEDMTPEGYEVIDEWNEGKCNVVLNGNLLMIVFVTGDDDQDPWMLEDDYRQAGGQAEVVEEPIPDINELYELVPYSHKEYKRYYSGRISCGVQFKDTSQMNDCYDLVPKVWDNILEKLSGHLDPDDKIGLSIDHPCLTDAIPFPLMKKKFLNGHKIAEKVAHTQQSKKELSYGADMKVIFTYSQLPIGSGYKRDYQGSVKNHKEKISGHGGTFISIKNEDNTCCARAIITAKANLDNDPKWNSIRLGDIK
ncbi:MAG: hypothetical protein GY799_12120 [Desulfobulbaceae bacterium]|nr:hypothetical protein [Desulfobulbaceae bacterium]